MEDTCLEKYQLSSASSCCSSKENQALETVDHNEKAFNEDSDNLERSSIIYLPILNLSVLTQNEDNSSYLAHKVIVHIKWNQIK